MRNDWCTCEHHNSAVFTRAQPAALQGLGTGFGLSPRLEVVGSPVLALFKQQNVQTLV